MSGGKRNVILVGDIGGTNTRLAIIELVKGRYHFLAEQTFPSREEPSLESALRKFLAKPVPPITRPAFGVAGPVRHGRSEATNLPWVIDSQEKDPPAVITENALAGKSPLCTQALDLFVSLYGAEAGNMALNPAACISAEGSHRRSWPS